MPTLADVVGPVRALGAPPMGDPCAARAYAARIRGTAQQVRATRRLLARQGRLEAFEGGAAERHAASVHSLGWALDERCHRLEHLAARIENEAAALEGAQRRWRSSIRGLSADYGSLVQAALRRLGWRLP